MPSEGRVSLVGGPENAAKSHIADAGRAHAATWTTTTAGKQPPTPSPDSPVPLIAARS